jgi:hypothetical protein
MLVEGLKYRFWLAPGASAEERREAAHAICRHLIDPPRPQAELRRVVIRTALNLYEGSVSRRAKELERRYWDYLASGWRRERDLEELPAPRSIERLLLRRLARVNDGRALCWRHIIRIAGAVA